MTNSLYHIRTISAVLVSLLVCAILVGGALPAVAGEAENAQQLVDRATKTLNTFVADKDMGPSLKTLLKKAHGVLIYPRVFRGAFVVGAAGGSGTFVAYDATAKKWGGPAFYTIGEASFGLQAGGDASEVVLVALTERGMTALLATSAKLGADVGIAVGPVGAGAEAATANLSADIIACHEPRASTRASPSRAPWWRPGARSTRPTTAKRSARRTSW